MLTYSPSVRRALAALFALALIWGYNWVVMKRALAYMGPFQFAAARMLLAALMLFAVVIVTKRPWRPRALPQTLLIGLLQTCGFSALIMWALLAAGAALAGLTCILEPWHLHGSLLSDVLAVAAGLCWALAVILAKRLQRRGPAVDVLAFTAGQMFMGALPLLVLASVIPAPPTHWTPYLVVALAYIVIACNALAWPLWLFALQRPGQGIAGNDVVGQGADEVRRPVRRRCRYHRRHRQQRQCAHDHLPRRERQHIDGRSAPLPPLGEDDRQCPAQARRHRQHVAQQAAVQMPRFQYAGEARPRRTGRQPLQVAQPFAEQRPCQQHHPERHGVAQHRDLAGTARQQRPHDERGKTAGLQQADQQRLRQGARPPRPLGHDHHREQHQCGQQHARGGEQKRAHVRERAIPHRPGVTPDQRKGEQRRQRSPDGRRIGKHAE